MVKIIQTANTKQYMCEACGLHYLESEWAEKCETWCTKYNSCNLEIIAHAIKSTEEIDHPPKKNLDSLKILGNRILSFLSPVLGTGAVGVCPLCWAASASFLTYIGLGVLIPFWRKIAIAFLLLGLIGFILDYRKHRNIIPIVLLFIGGITLYLGRYIFVIQPKLHIFSGIEGFAGWPIWGLGGLLIIVAVFYNRWLFRKPKSV